MGGQKIREPLGCNFYSSFLSQERSREKPNLKKTLPSLSQGRVLGRRGQCGYSLKTVVLLSCPLPDTEGELPCCSCQSFYNQMENYYQIEIKCEKAAFAGHRRQDCLLAAVDRRRN